VRVRPPRTPAAVDRQTVADPRWSSPEDQLGLARGQQACWCVPGGPPADRLRSINSSSINRSVTRTVLSRTWTSQTGWGVSGKAWRTVGEGVTASGWLTICSLRRGGRAQGARAPGGPAPARTLDDIVGQDQLLDRASRSARSWRRTLSSVILWGRRAPEDHARAGHRGAHVQGVRAAVGRERRR